MRKGENKTCKRNQGIPFQTLSINKQLRIRVNFLQYNLVAKKVDLKPLEYMDFFTDHFNPASVGFEKIPHKCRGTISRTGKYRFQYT